MTLSTLRPLGLPIVVLAFAVACGGNGEPPKSPSANPGAAIPADRFVTSAPGKAIGIQAAKTSAKSGDAITVRGVIGGRKKPFVGGRSIMVIIDTGLQACAPGEGCPTPWDYCCETKEDLLANTATVQIVDASGAPFPQSLDGVHGLAALRTVTVSGTVRTTEGGLVIDAEKIHIADS